MQHLHATQALRISGMLGKPTGAKARRVQGLYQYLTHDSVVAELMQQQQQQQQHSSNHNNTSPSSAAMRALQHALLQQQQQQQQQPPGPQL